MEECQRFAKQYINAIKVRLATCCPCGGLVIQRRLAGRRVWDPRGVPQVQATLVKACGQVQGQGEGRVELVADWCVLAGL